MGAAPRGDELPALSFFEEDDQPRRTTPRPRRARPAGGAVITDSQTLLIRRAVAGVGLVLFLILLAIAVNSCRDSQRRSALTDYNRQLSTVAEESSSQVGAPFFQLLSEGGGTPQDLQSQISQYRVVAEQQYERVENLDVPGDMTGAQQSALIALEWRRDGLDKIAQQIGPALGDEGDAADRAMQQIAGQMEVFLSSDVTWETRVVPFVKQALEDGGVTGQRINRSVFVQDLRWLQPQTIATVLDQQLTSGGGNDGGGEPTGPGLHGTGLDATSYGDVTLQPGVANELTFEPSQGFTVRFTNQGENEEFDIKVTLRIQSDGSDPITLSDTIPRLAPGESATAELPLEDTPPLDTAATIRTTVARVPGEEKSDNNRSEYPVRFSRG
jgi:hypothetical protein